MLTDVESSYRGTKRERGTEVACELRKEKKMKTHNEHDQKER